MTTEEILEMYIHTDMGEEERDNLIEAAQKEPEWDQARKDRESLPLNYLKDDEREKAIDRLIAIPSELEVMLFLHDQGKILNSMHADIVDWVNIYNGGDILFSDKQEGQPGYTNLAGIDVKNVGLNKYGKDYTNLLIEVTGARPWTAHYLKVNGTPPPNRYLAYVRGGKLFGGTLSTELFGQLDLSKSEREHTEEIVRYYFDHAETLNHKILIIRGESMSDYLDGKWNYQARTWAGKSITGIDFTRNPQVANWKKQYPMMEIDRMANGWDIKEVGKGRVGLTTTPMETKHEGSWRQFYREQKEGLSLMTLLQMKGIQQYKVECMHKKEIDTRNSKRIGKAWE